MKTTMKISLISICLIISTSISAQLPITFGAKAGINFSEIYDFDDDLKVGFHFGVTVDYELTSDWYIMSGLEFTTKGAKGNIDGASFLKESGYKGTIVKSKDGKQNPMYLQIPIHAGYKLGIAPGTKLVFRAGPYLAYGIAGKSKGKYTILDIDVMQDVEMDENFFDNGAKRFEFGIGGAVGAEFGKIGVNLGADLALTKIWEGTSAKNRCAYLSLGYKF